MVLAIPRLQARKWAESLTNFLTALLRAFKLHFTYRKILPFKVSKSTWFSILTELRNPYHNQFQSIFITPENYPLAVTPHAAMNLLSVSVDLPTWDISQKRSPSACGMV